jgi:hypothetical protein
MESTREELDEREHGVKPSKLGRRIEKWAAAIDTSETRVTIDKPIQSGVQTRGIKDSRGSEKRQVTEELSQSVGNEKGIGKSGTTKRSRRKRRRLNDSKSDREKIRMGIESEWNGAELRGERKPCNSAIRKKEMTAGTSSGRRLDTGVVDRNARQRPKMDR